MANNDELAPGGWAGKGYVPNMYVKYKINLQEFNQMYQAQGEKCAGCQGQFAHPLIKSFELGLKPEVDHKHVTGRACEKQDVRGLLCPRCNRLLGKVRDNIDLLKRLGAYLQAHGDSLL